MFRSQTIRRLVKQVKGGDVDAMYRLFMLRTDFECPDFSRIQYGYDLQEGFGDQRDIYGANHHDALVEALHQATNNFYWYEKNFHRSADPFSLFVKGLLFISNHAFFIKDTTRGLSDPASFDFDNNEDHAWGFFLNSALLGYPEAQYQIGQWYECSMDDRGRALMWYRLAAEQGLPVAQVKTGELLAGLNVSGFGGGGDAEDKADPSINALIDYEEAVSWWEQAAEQGFPAAMYNLARYYREDHAQNEATAYKWYVLACARDRAYKNPATPELGISIRPLMEIGPTHKSKGKHLAKQWENEHPLAKSTGLEWSGRKTWKPDFENIARAQVLAQEKSLARIADKFAASDSLKKDIDWVKRPERQPEDIDALIWRVIAIVFWGLVTLFIVFESYLLYWRD